MAKPPKPLDIPEAPEAPAAPPVVQPKQPERTFASTREKAIDLIKLEVALCLKNRSWRTGEADTENVEHVHFFHSHDPRNGTPSKYASFTGGHTHEVICRRDAKGDIILDSLECGPPLQQKSKKMPNGTTRKALETIDLGMDARSGRQVVGSHTHVVTYKKSQNVSVNI